MSKTVHQNFDIDALKYYELEDAPQYGVASNSACEIKSIVFSDSQKTFKQVYNDLYIPTIKQFGSEKRAFLLPRSPVSIDRVKAALKEHGIILTNDYTDCDLIITHQQITNDFNDGTTIQASVMLAKLWNYSTISKSSRMPHLGGYHNQTGNSIIYDDKFPFNIWGEEYDALMEGWMFTGLAINLAHMVKTLPLSVMNVEDVIYQSATKQILDEQMIHDITSSLESSDEDSIALTGKILPTIDYTQNYHLLWKLAHDINHRLRHYNKNKDVQYWMKASKMSDFYYMSAEDMILWLENEGELDKVNFRYLEPIVRREIRIDNRNLYVFKVQVKPEYRKLLKNKL